MRRERSTTAAEVEVAPGRGERDPLVGSECRRTLLPEEQQAITSGKPPIASAETIVTPSIQRRSIPRPWIRLTTVAQKTTWPMAATASSK